MTLPRLLGLALVLGLLGACATQTREPVSESLGAASLAGTVWTGSGEPAHLDDVRTAAWKAHFTILGETHGNAGHHRMQADLLAAAASSAQRPTLVWEMLPRSLQAQLDAYLASPDATPAGLGPAIGWEDLGWPDWTLYEPIARAALDAGLPQKAGDVDRSLISKIARGDLEALPSDDPAGIGLRDPLPPALDTDLDRVISEAHCNLLPPSALPGIKAAQRVRDGALASTMAETGNRAVLVAGRGHARSDWGVPRLLRRLAPEKTVLSVGLLEVQEGLADPKAYGLLSATGEPLFDYVYFTEGPDRGDPCEGLKDRLPG